MQELFSARKDFPLQWEDFSATSVETLEQQERGLQQIAGQLRIHPDATLVIDDNLGEIAGDPRRSIRPLRAGMHRSRH